MENTDPSVVSSVVAVYSSEIAAEQAVRHLYEAGLALEQISIIGRDVRETEKPIGLRNRGDYVEAAAETGAVAGLLSGLAIGAGFLVFPQIGPVMVAGEIATALLGGIEGGAAGAVVGGLAGALIGWKVPKERAITYETHIEGGKFLVMVRSTPAIVARARKLLATNQPEHLDVYEPATS